MAVAVNGLQVNGSGEAAAAQTSASQRPAWPIALPSATARSSSAEAPRMLEDVVMREAIAIASSHPAAFSPGSHRRRG